MWCIFHQYFLYAANSTVLAILCSLQRYETCSFNITIPACSRIVFEVFYSQVRPFSISSIQINLPVIVQRTVKVNANMHRYACIFKSNFQCWMILIGDKLNNCIQRSLILAKQDNKIANVYQNLFFFERFFASLINSCEFQKKKCCIVVIYTYTGANLGIL